MADKPRVFLCYALPPAARARLEAFADVSERDRETVTPGEIIAASEGADAFLCTNQIKIPNEIFETRSRLRVISQVGVGYDNIDPDAATRAGILVCNTPGVLTNAVAELTFGLMITLSRRLATNGEYVRQGRWNTSAGRPAPGTDLYDKVLGIIGLGRIGRAVARRAHAFGMRVIFNDIFVDPGAEGFARYRDKETLFRESDFLTLHCDLNDQTRHLVNERSLGLMKASAYLINASRGPVVDQPALAAALKAGQIAGAALDVLEKEPPSPDDPILTLDNVLLTPHIGTRTSETTQAMIDLAVENLISAVQSGRAPAMVNPEVVVRV